MRIAYVTHYFPPAGFAASTNTYEIVKGLVKKGHELLVFCPQTFSKYTATLSMQGKTWSSNSLKVYASLPTPLLLSTTIPHLFNLLKVFKHQYDLVITQFHLFHLASFPGFLLKILKGKRWVVRVHDMIPDPSISSPFFERIFINSCYGVFLRSIGKKADKLLVLTEEIRSLLTENGHLPSKVAVVPNGVDTKIFYPEPSKTDSNLQRSILYIGSIMPEDGVDSLIKAFSLLDKENQLKLVIIGDGPERLHLFGLVKRLNLGKKVTFYRYVRHDLIPEFIRGAYITVGPLRFSPINAFTIPTKILEYFACGKPVVSSPVSKDILRDEFTGFVVKDATPEKIAEKFSVLIEDKELATRMGKNARQLVKHRFDWMRITDLLEKEIEEVGAF